MPVRERLEWGRLDEAIAVVLSVSALLLFLPNATHEFLRFDDDAYITANEMVKRGLTLDGIYWAFTSEHFLNWLPVTTLSHMLDVQLYGLEPAGHHVTSILIHAVNAALAFVALRVLTERRWPSAVVALLFSVHPQRVESVAWLAERKDLLAATFFFLCLIAYARYAARPSISRYAWVTVTLALGLMSKTMIVTLPFLLLILDWWPLERLSIRNVLNGPPASNTRTNRKRLSWLIVEKLPLLALAVIASTWTMYLQQRGGATDLTQLLTFSQRLANGVVGVWRYIGKVVLPIGLSPFYSHPHSWPIALIVVAGLALCVTFVIALRHTRRSPYVLAGWCWFLGMLVPVSGVFIHAGGQSIADRYMYLPVIGLLIAVVWTVADLVHRRPSLTVPAGIATAIFTLGFAAATAQYQAKWHNDRTLFGHAIALHPDNWLAHVNLARLEVAEGRPEAAVEHFRRAVLAEPSAVGVRVELATLLLMSGPQAAAESASQFRAVVKTSPQTAEAWVGLARAELIAGRAEESYAAFAEAARRSPGNPDILAQWSLALIRQGRVAEAREKAEQALSRDPTNEVAKVALSRIVSAATQPTGTSTP